MLPAVARARAACGGLPLPGGACSTAKLPIYGEAWRATTAFTADHSCISAALHAREDQLACSQSSGHGQHARLKFADSTAFGNQVRAY